MQKNMLNATKLFTTPLSTMSFQTSVPIDICQQILDLVADKMVPDPEIFTYSPPRPRFNDPIIDQLLAIPESGIVEICGQAGSGKSHIAYQLAVNERVFDMSRKVILISTEGRIATSRLEQMCANKPFSADDIMEGIIVPIAESVDHLRNIIQDYLPSLFFDPSEPPPSLVIIDSIAALFRLEYEVSDAPARSRLLFDITTTLKWISSTHNTLIVATNQATANITTFATDSNDWVPALGLSWSNCVNFRIRVSKTPMKHDIPAADQIVTAPGNPPVGIPRSVAVRTMYVEISPVRQDVRGEFYIDTDGLHGL